MIRDVLQRARSALQAPLDYGLATVWLAFPVVGLLAPKGLFIVVLILAALVLPQHIKKQAGKSILTVLCLALLLPMYGLISAPFSPVDIDQAAIRSLRLAVEFSIGAFVVWAMLTCEPKRLSLTIYSFFLGCCIVTLIMAWLVATTPIFKFVNLYHIDNNQGNIVSRGITIIAVLTIPLSHWVYCRLSQQAYRAKIFSDLWLFVFGFVVLMSGKTTSLLALALAAITAISTNLIRWIAPVLLACFIGVSTFLPVIAASTYLSDVICSVGGVTRSLSHRDIIWKFAAEKIAERPVLGWGMDSSRAMPGGDARIPIPICKRIDRAEPLEQLMPLHPHNGMLQIWLELGGIGTAISVIVATIAMVKITKTFRHKEAKALMVAHLVALGLLIFMSFGVWQGWWLSTITLVVGLAITICRDIDLTLDKRSTVPSDQNYQTLPDSVPLGNNKED